MQKMGRFAIIFMVFFSTQTLSQEPSTTTSALQTLSLFLGYDLSQSPLPNTLTGVCAANPKSSQACQNLLYYPNPTNITGMQTILTDMLNTFVGALIPSSGLNYFPNNTSGSATNYFPSSSSSTTPAQCTPLTPNATLQQYTSAMCTSPSASVSTSQTQSILANALIDQSAGSQPDPVSQAVLNTLTTPDYSYCLNGLNGTSMLQSSSGSATSCPYPNLYGTEVMMQVIGSPLPPAGQYPLPTTNLSYLSPTYNQPLIAQLNSNSLITPLMYQTEPCTSDGNNNNNANQSCSSLTANNQLEQAANFIRYVTNAVSPLPMPTLQNYTTVYKAATDTPTGFGKSTYANMLANQTILGTFLTGLRVYAAQTSVGIANLYYIMSKRIPQPSQTASTGSSGSDGTKSNSENISQALSEFNMATWRLYNTGQTAQSSNPQWLTQINTATSATVQKEIAVLLAEINYQLYLNRQQEERLLMTESVLLLQNSANQRPNPSLGQ